LSRLADNLAAFAGRCLAKADRFRSARPRTAEAAPAETQSVDQLLTILQKAEQGKGHLSAQLSPAEVRKAFYRWQFAAASGIAAACMMVPWRVEQRGRDGTWERTDDHPLVHLLQTVNEFMTGEELLYYSILECVLTGQCFLKITAENGMVEPAELWPLIGTVKPKQIDKETGNVETWEQQLSTRKAGRLTVTHEAAQIVYLRLPKPGDLYAGYGPGQAVGSSVRLDQQIVESEWAAFKQGLFPFMIVKMAERDATKRQQIMNALQEAYGGAQKTGKAVGIGQHMDVTWPPNKPRDMGYAGGADQTRKEILGGYRYPEAMLGMSQSVNKSSVHGMEYIFAKWNIAPLLTLLYARLNQDLTWRHFDQERNTRLAFDSPVPADRTVQLQEEEMDLRNGAATIDEVREKRGREPLPNGLGALPLLPTNLAPIGSPPPEKPGAQALALAAPSTMRRSGRTARQRREISVAYSRKTLQLVSRLRRRFAAIFDDLAERVLEAFEKDKEEFAQVLPVRWIMRLPAHVDRELDPAEFAAEIAAKAKPEVRLGLLLGGNFQGSLLPEPGDYAWDDGMAVIAEWAQRFDAMHWTGVAKATRDALTAAVAKGVEENETWDDLRVRIVKTFGKMRESRAAANPGQGVGRQLREHAADARRGRRPSGEER